MTEPCTIGAEFAVMQHQVHELTDDVSELKHDVKALRQEDIPAIRETLARMEQNGRDRADDCAKSIPRWVTYAVMGLIAIIAALVGAAIPG